MGPQSSRSTGYVFMYGFWSWIVWTESFGQRCGGVTDESTDRIFVSREERDIAGDRATVQRGKKKKNVKDIKQSLTSQVVERLKRFVQVCPLAVLSIGHAYEKRFYYYAMPRQRKTRECSKVNDLSTQYHTLRDIVQHSRVSFRGCYITYVDSMLWTATWCFKKSDIDNLGMLLTGYGT